MAAAAVMLRRSFGGSGRRTAGAGTTNSGNDLDFTPAQSAMLAAIRRQVDSLRVAGGGDLPAPVG
jgi:hypothetical protein